jgi:hypothetical protein
VVSVLRYFNIHMCAQCQVLEHPAPLGYERMVVGIYQMPAPMKDKGCVWVMSLRIRNGWLNHPQIGGLWYWVYHMISGNHHKIAIKSPLYPLRSDASTTRISILECFWMPMDMSPESKPWDRGPRIPLERMGCVAAYRGPRCGVDFFPISKV